MHGRAVPPAGRDLLEEFAEALDDWEWHVALLQEVPPWWGDALADRAGAEVRSVLTSRNWLAPARRFVAVRWPDLIKSNGGGSNAILVRGEEVLEHRVMRLGWWPERRWMHAVRLGSGIWVGNAHTEARADQGRLAGATLLSWARGSPAALGGDFNVPDLWLPGYSRAGANGVDQVFVTAGKATTKVLERGLLSDHSPLVVSVVDLGS